MDRRVFELLVDLYGDMRVLQWRLQTIIKEYHMALDPSTEAALQRVTDAITNEIQELKDMVTGGTDPTEINARLDELAASVSAISDNIKTA